MIKEKYSLVPIKVSSLLGDIAQHEIAVPEIQRPFVWKRSQVRDLMDSLYKGYPTGYLIIWHNPNVKLKDGSSSSGKKILIDGQQRVTALRAAIAGEPVVNADYKLERIKIAFDPFAAIRARTENDVEVFKVQDQGILKSDRWIKDISEIFKDGFKTRKFEDEYCQRNPEMDVDALDEVISDLKAIGNREFGVVQLDKDLDIDLVTDIFIRINSKGTVLSQGDFVMSKIAADEGHGGNLLRKLIDYFSHLSVVPAFYSTLASVDEEFAASEYMQKIAWLRGETEDVFDPTCDDVIRVAFMDQYPRAKLADLVSLLSGRNFDTRDFEAGIVEQTYNKLKEGVLDVVNENHFKGFMNIIRGAGFISPKLVNSRMAIDFAYVLYLRLRRDASVSTGALSGIVQRWYVLSVLTGRYSSSPETAFYRDLKLINENGVEKTLKAIEEATLSENFWAVAVPQELRQTSPINPTYQVYLAAQVVMKDVSLLSKNMFVGDILKSADVHHIFPKAYLTANGFEKSSYNQNANMAYLDDRVNKSVGKRAPKDYFAAAYAQCETGTADIGAITDLGQLRENLAMNCIPEEVRNWDFSNYEEFLDQRRSMMAAKIRRYYEGL